MPAPTKKHRIDSANIIWQGSRYSVPIKVLEKYKSEDDSARHEFESVETVFKELIDQFKEPGVLLRGLRTREGLAQVEFAKMIGITQQNLSAMENGRRGMGKELAKRIAKKFGINYRLLL